MRQLCCGDNTVRGGNTYKQAKGNPYYRSPSFGLSVFPKLVVFWCVDHTRLSSPLHFVDHFTYSCRGVEHIILRLKSAQTVVLLFVYL